MRRIALIPARGGSKRLPRKNIADFEGRPIIAWTIESARAAGLFDEVLVSTEDAEISAIAQKHGAAIDRRSPELATDDARVLDVCVDFLDRREKAGQSYDILCALYPTAPLRTAEDIAATVALIEPGVCEFSMAVTSYPLAPHQAMRIAPAGDMSPMWPDLIEKRASEIGALCTDNGSTYAVYVPAFRRLKSFFGPGLKGHMMPRERSQDIDEPIDLEIARVLARRMKAGTA